MECQLTNIGLSSWFRVFVLKAFGVLPSVCFRVIPWLGLSLCDELRDVVHALLRHLAHLFARAQAERMRDDRYRQLGIAERARLRPAEREKRRRADRHGGAALFCR